MITEISIIRYIYWENKTIQAEKVYDANQLLCIPRQGDLWEDGSFITGSPAEVKEIRFNYDENFCIVYLDEHHFEESEDPDFIQKVISNYEDGDWIIEDI